MKNGNPMMWSQCAWDMNAWNRWPEAPRVARTSLPKTRAPEPRSQRTKSRWPVTISTHDELPPNVCEPAKSSSRSRKAAACSGVSSLRPDARVSAEMSLRRTSADVMATGIEPRVPQNLTFKRPSGGIERGERLGREPGKALADRREHIENHREPADVEDLADGRLQRRDPEGAALSLGLLGGQHQDAEPHATDVLDAGEIQDHAVLPLGAASHMWRKGGLEVLRGRVVDPAHGGEHHRVHIAFRLQVHVGSMEMACSAGFNASTRPGG